MDDPKSNFIGTNHPWVINALWAVISLVLYIALSFIIYYFWLYPRAGESVFVLSDLRVTGSRHLCPGDTLDFVFNVDVKEVGTYNLFMSTWKVDPPPSTIIFSELQPFVIGSPRTFPIPRKWLIPETYVDPADSTEKPMVAGDYTRDIDVKAEGRDTRNDPLIIEFNIREDCP